MINDVIKYILLIIWMNNFFQRCHSNQGEPAVPERCCWNHFSENEYFSQYPFNIKIIIIFNTLGPPPPKK